MARKFFPIVVLALAFAVFYMPDVFDPESIRGKRVLITGASSGIGEELAYQYSHLGASIIVTARRGDLLKRVSDKCRQMGAASVEYIIADMAVDKDREKLMLEVERLTNGHLDHLILNHVNSGCGPFLSSEQNMTSLLVDLNINFVSYVDIATRSIKLLSASEDGGHIGVVSSLLGKVGMPLLASYSADKFALTGFFTSWRQELRSRMIKPPSITICVLGYINTESSNKVVAAHYQSSKTILASPAGVEETALAIMKGVTRGAYEICYPKLVDIVLFIHKIIPGYFENMLALYH